MLINKLKASDLGVRLNKRARSYHGVCANSHIIANQGSKFFHARVNHTTSELDPNDLLDKFITVVRDYRPRLDVDA